MKRLILTTTGTVAGLVALLSFKTHAPSAVSAAALPSAGTGARASTSARSVTAVGYTGTAVTTRYGIVQVKVTVAGGKITDVAFVQLTAFDPHSQEINSYAAPQLLQETLTAQSARVDAVSGATYTSEGYRESLQAALDRVGLG